MNCPTKYIVNYVKDSVQQNLHLFIYILSVLFVANLTLVYTIATIYVERTVVNVKKNVFEYEEIDLEHLCILSDCLYISTDNITYSTNLEYKDIKQLKQTDEVIETILKISNNGYITNKLDVYIKLAPINGFVVININDIMEILKTQSLNIIFIILFLNISLLIVGLRHNNKIRYLNVLKRDSEIYSKNVAILTENLHHELNTPLTVVSNKIHKIEHFFEKIKTDRNCSLCKREKEACLNHFDEFARDFKLVDASLLQLSDVLDKMKAFKSLKKDNEKNIYEVLETTINVLLVTQSEHFKVIIDEDLHNFTLNNTFMQNGELIAVILNLLKNSIDAHSTNIKITMENAVKIGELSFFIADNGNGIKSHNINKIYDEDFSTKSNGEKRGNGLFINKQLLEGAKGSLKLVKTDKAGTIFKLNIKAEWANIICSDKGEL